MNGYKQTYTTKRANYYSVSCRLRLSTEVQTKELSDLGSVEEQERLSRFKIILAVKKKRNEIKTIKKKKKRIQMLIAKKCIRLWNFNTKFHLILHLNYIH